MSQDHTPSPDPQPSEPSPSVAPASAQASPKVSTPATSLQKVKQFWQTAQSLILTLGSTAVQLGKQVRSAWNVIQPQVQRWWEAILPKIRGILPQAWNDRLTDRMMTSGAIALSVFLLWLGTSLLFPSRPTVAKTPPASVVTRAPKAPSFDPKKLTAIQDQLAEVAAPYAAGLSAPGLDGSGLDGSGLDAPKLIDWVRVNANKALLKVQLGDGWYGLDSAQQDQLANDLLKRSLKLQFSQLELADAAGQPLARSPVVGSKMVVLRRSL
ncbi:MAG: hypothetical protein HC781_10770 [Leptolyngbyaceae cyanobacterium CSU_1_4]|nr:hypothetical protein [Leptolyngbyaceae cyanobacterium CSU_1_4]